eukprot:Gb_03940 [translate_table: standard]
MLLTVVLEAPLLKDWLRKDPDSGNPDALLLALKLHDKLPLELGNMCKLKRLFVILEFTRSDGSCVQLDEDSRSDKLVIGKKDVVPSMRVDAVEEDDESLPVTTNDPGDLLRSWVVDCLYHLSRNATLDATVKFCLQKKILNFLAVKGLFTASLGIEAHKRGSDFSKMQAMHFLLIQLLLQILLRPGEVCEMTTKLVLCCKKAFGSVVELEVEDQDDEGEPPVLIDVLVDTLLSLLPQSPAPVRGSVEQSTVVGDSDEEDLVDIEESDDNLEEQEGKFESGEEDNNTDDNCEEQTGKFGTVLKPSRRHRKSDRRF